MTTLERKQNPSIGMETGVIFNRVISSKAGDPGFHNKSAEVAIAKLADHLANEPGAIDVLRSLQNVDTQK